MKHPARAVALAFLVMQFQAVAASAGPLHALRNPEWWARKAVIAGALLADYKTTCDGFHHGFMESNPVNRGNTSCGQTAGLLLAGGAFYNLMDHLAARSEENSPHKWARIVTRWEAPVIVGAIHGSAAAHNAALLGARK